MRSWDLAAGAVWAMTPSALETVLEVASRCGEGPDAVAARLGRPLENARTVTVRDGVAVVPVVGPLFRRANLLTQVSGATSVEVLATDLREAAANPSVRAILLDVDSPGGEANGVGELAGMIRTLRGVKPVHAYIGGQGCSGAYWIASACERVTLADTAQAGSIGVVAVYRKDEDVKAVEFVSSQSPQKRPDLETEEGRSQVQRVVDDIAAVFVRDVAANRGVAEKRVLSDFGSGGVLVGQAAVAAGLADGLGSFEGVLAALSGRRPELQSANCKVQSAKSSEPGRLESAELGTRKGRSMDATRDVETNAPADPAGVLGDAGGAALGGDVEGAAMEAAAANVGGGNVAELLERISALESEQAVLQAREARRQVGETLASMRFGEQAHTLTPACRTQLEEALMPIGADLRGPLLGAIKGMAFVSLGERGFTASEETETLSAADEAHVRGLAARSGLGYEEMREQFLSVRRRKAGV